ncbi:hypothetical protein PR048_011454 [Dryococelus australis]|uniref:Uncharacterized protein n=1 Tax=Dryococelus australis TaxID=614101 RepID=A0ABQ9HLN8_9NEOP|nr:hypothetical protein PR048_011454 [Dryococelus australis]
MLVQHIHVNGMAQASANVSRAKRLPPRHAALLLPTCWSSASVHSARTYALCCPVVIYAGRCQRDRKIQLAVPITNLQVRFSTQSQHAIGFVASVRRIAGGLQLHLFLVEMPAISISTSESSTCKFVEQDGLLFKETHLGLRQAVPRMQQVKFYGNAMILHMLVAEIIKLRIVRFLRDTSGKTASNQ